MEKPYVFVAIAALLLIALLPLPYGYYTFLRLTVTISAAFAIYSFWEDTPWLAWIFISVAILFNPLIPVYLDRQIWAILDVITAGIFSWAAWRCWQRE